MKELIAYARSRQGQLSFAAFVDFAASADIKEQLSNIGAEPTSLSPAEFGAMISRDLARWKKVAHEAAIRL